MDARLLIDLLAPAGSSALLGLFIYFWFKYKFRVQQRAFLGWSEIQRITLIVLNRGGLLTPKDWEEIESTHRSLITDLLRMEMGNPLSAEEMNRFRRYIDKIRHGELFTIDEAKDFNQLATRLREEKPDHAGAWIIVALAALVLGYVLGKSEKKD
jgi:hypothetical protein